MIRHLWPLLTVLAGSASQAQTGIDLPDIGDSSGAVVSEQDEREYGKALIREFRRLAHAIDDPLVEGYLRHLGYSLVAHSDKPEKAFSFFVVDDDSVNAFAAPGGFIGVHTGLIIAAETESELAGVLAHEIAHVTQRHLARAIETAKQVNLPMMLLMLGAAIAGGGDADVVNTALIGGHALVAQMQINFTRSNEYEADRVGIGTLARAGYDTVGMADFFGRIARLSRNYGGGPPEFLRTHPVETTRIAEAKNRAAQMSVADVPERDPTLFFLVRERLRVLTAEHPNEMVSYYLQLQEAGEYGPAEQYGLALARLRVNDPVGASETLSDLARTRPDLLPVQITMAEIELLSGQGEAAEDRFRDLHARFPDSHAVNMAYADTLLKVGGEERIREAESLLRPMLVQYAEDPGLFLLYSRAAADAGKQVRAQEAYAQHVFLQGRVYDAVTQLRKLLESPELDYYQRARVEARLAELQPILAEIQRENGWDPSEGRRPGDSLRGAILSVRP